MFRRLAVSRVAPRGMQPVRTYFFPNPGETGISAATLKSCLWITLGLIGIQSVLIRIGIFEGLSTKHQYIEDSTDLWENDGTVMEGEEAVANLKIQRERIMPFMDNIRDKMEAHGVAE